MMKFGIVAFPRSMALMYNDPNWLNITNILAGEWARTAIGTAAILVFTYIMLKGARWMMTFAYISAVAAGVAILAFALAALTGTGHFAANWTAMTGLDYNSVIPLSKGPDVGWVVGFTLIGTLMAAAVFTGQNTAGSTLSANIAGEIRGVQRSQLIALFGSLVICLVVWFFVYGVCYIAFGADWIGSLSALFNSGNAAYPLGSDPIPTLLAVYLVPGNPVYAFLMSLGFTITAFGTVASLGFAASRNIFAWSFDRMIPPRFSEIDRRFRSPYLVIALVGFSGWLLLMIDVWLPAVNAYATSTAICWFLGWMILGVGAMLYPYRNKSKHLFTSAPPIVQSRWFGVPVIFWMGLLTLIVAGFVEYSVAVPMFEGKVTFGILYLAVALILIPLIMYLVSSAYYKRRGVPIAKQFEEVPPE
jgi:amino acid transporter